MILPTRPNAIFSTLQGTQNLDTSQPCKELKMPTHSPPTPADEYLSSFVQHISDKSLLSTKAHPPPHNWTTSFWTDYEWNRKLKQTGIKLGQMSFSIVA